MRVFSFPFDIAANGIGHRRRDGLPRQQFLQSPVEIVHRHLGGFARIARSNPNAPSVVGAGMNPVVFGPALTAVNSRFSDSTKTGVAPVWWAAAMIYF